MRTLITNGTIVTADGSYDADVLVDGETIAAIGADLASNGTTAEETIDATGRYVIPGGIDVHTHMELPFGGTFAKDTFETGTRAAAFGGTTSIVDFAVQSKGRSLREGLDAWHAKAQGNAVTDYGFHMIVSDVTDDSLREMDQLVAEGIPDFKLFTAYPGVFYSDDGAIYRAMQQTAKNGGLIMMHAENGMAIDVVAADTVAEGTTDPIGHGLARKPVFEGEATNRVIRLAEAAGVPVYIVHLSARDALEEVREARDRGSMAFAETCPQYLFLSLDDMGHGFEGAKFVCSPPLRSRDHWEELWRGLVKDDLQVVSTDHCPFDFEGQKELGRGDFRKIPNGLPGVEDRVAESLLEDLEASFAAMRPSDPVRIQLWRDVQANLQNVVRRRWSLVEESEGTIPPALLVVVTSWLAVIFASFGYRAPRNAVVITTLVAAAFLIAVAFYLILDLDQPFAGAIEVSSAPLQRAEEQISR